MGEIEGAERFKQMVGSFYAAMPDLNVEVNDLIAERDTVVGLMKHIGAIPS
jgi:predicted ester cyclase